MDKTQWIRQDLVLMLVFIICHLVGGVPRARMHLGLHFDLHDRMFDKRTAIRVPTPRLCTVSNNKVKDLLLQAETGMHNKVSCMVNAHLPIVGVWQSDKNLCVLGQRKNAELVGVGNPTRSEVNLEVEGETAQTWGLSPFKTDLHSVMFRRTTVKTREIATRRALNVVCGWRRGRNVCRTDRANRLGHVQNVLAVLGLAKFEHRAAPGG